MIPAGNLFDDETLQMHDYFMRYARGGNNDELLARMLASWRTGGGSMPERMGLSADMFEHMITHHFPSAPRDLFAKRDPIPESRSEEYDELCLLLRSHRRMDEPSSLWMSTLVAAGCMGGNHLWQDLGLWSRDDLSALMNYNFPVLSGKNDRDMKWKKFLYKQLCEAEGVYVCRSPSCEVCKDYADCFGPEH